MIEIYNNEYEFPIECNFEIIFPYIKELTKSEYFLLLFLKNGKINPKYKFHFDSDILSKFLKISKTTLTKSFNKLVSLGIINPKYKIGNLLSKKFEETYSVNNLYINDECNIENNTRFKISKSTKIDKRRKKNFKLLLISEAFPVSSSLLNSISKSTFIIYYLIITSQLKSRFFNDQSINESLGISISTIEKAMNTLRNIGLIETEFERKDSPEIKKRFIIFNENHKEALIEEFYDNEEEFQIEFIKEFSKISKLSYKSSI